ncbi:MAG TPA: lytic murein transglycosylase [Candidatus Dormibacteraeota bacterium]
MRRALLSLTLSIAALLPALPAQAMVNQELVPVQIQYAKAWRAEQTDLGGAAARMAALKAQAEPPDLLGVLRHDLQLEAAQYDYRLAIRSQQQVIYALAIDQNLEDQVTGLLPSADLPPLRDAIEALRALWRAARIDDFTQVQVRHNRRFQDSAPIAQLVGFYHASGARYGIDWSFLASINFIESDFGRVNGPSSAGAMGPMQFMPGTWADYGVGDIMSPHDSIEAAARYLHAMGGPGNMDRAIYRYNNDSDYVASVEDFAAALREDPGWLDRLYYWSTAG